MKDNEKKTDKQERKPDEELNGSVSAHLVIRDTQNGKEILNRRG